MDKEHNVRFERRKRSSNRFERDQSNKLGKNLADLEERKKKRNKEREREELDYNIFGWV